MFKAVRMLKGKIILLSFFIALGLGVNAIFSIPKLQSFSPRLQDKAVITVDDLGVPRIIAQGREDAYSLQGLVTARDRFFQMDLIRKRMQGRLSEYFGEKALIYDKHFRSLGLKEVVKQALKIMPLSYRKELEAYARGVNTYLNKKELPIEYLILRVMPEPWRAEDSLFVVLAMFYDLDFMTQYPGERLITELRKKRSASVVKFLTPSFGPWSVPFQKETLPELEIPSKHELNIKEEDYSFLPLQKFNATHLVSGSNAFAVAARKSQNGKPMLAGDPHLGLRAPNIWYRLQLEFAGEKLTGVCLPGVPGVAIGTNEYYAWSFTAGYADNLDLIIPNSNHEFTEKKEILKVKNQDDVSFSYQVSEHGPLLGKYILKWTALNPKLLATLSFTPVNKAKSLSEIKQAASEWAGPIQNLIFATNDNHIGWILVGHLPQRKGFDGSYASIWGGGVGWEGTKDTKLNPSYIDPESGFVFSGNHRKLGLKDNYSFNFPMPTRAFDLRKNLAESNSLSRQDLFTLQQSTRSYTYDFYKKLIDRHFAGSGKWESAIRKVVKNWQGTSSLHEVGYAFLKQFRLELLNILIAPLWGIDPVEDPLGRKLFPLRNWKQHEVILAKLFAEKPNHLLHSEFVSYENAVMIAALRAAEKLADNPEQLKELTWREHRKVAISHPFAKVLPWPFKKLFQFPEAEVPGDGGVVLQNIISENHFHGVSMRFVYDFSDKNNSVFNQPGGQSGHFFSKNFSDQFSSWLVGKETKFYPNSAILKVNLPKQ